MRSGIALVLVTVTACGDGASARSSSETEDPLASDTSCLWAVDSMLQEVDLPVEDRVNCDVDSSALDLGFEETRDAEFACWRDAIDSRLAAEWTVNFCVDCQIPISFIAMTDGQLAQITMEADLFGDELRTASVERCTDIIGGEDGYPECVEPVELYRCQEPLE